MDSSVRFKKKLLRLLCRYAQTPIADKTPQRILKASEKLSGMSKYRNRHKVNSPLRKKVKIISEIKADFFIF